MNEVKGDVHVCAHRVAYSYWGIEGEITDELKERLEQEAEERAKSQINEDFVGGELNCIFDFGEGETEIRGWWKID